MRRRRNCCRGELIRFGRHAEATEQLTALCGRDPYRERYWELIMVALYLSGRQADALRAYQRARDILVAELGIEPSARLRQLESDVLHQRVEGWTDPMLHRPMAEPAPTPGTPAVEVAHWAHRP